MRTVLSEQQLQTLRTVYASNPRPDALLKEQLVEITGLSPRVIRVWFQNKRCKDKKKAIQAEAARMHQQQAMQAGGTNVSEGGREGGRDGGRQTDRQRKTQRERWRDTDRERQRERETNRQTDRDRERDRETQRETEREELRLSSTTCGDNDKVYCIHTSRNYYADCAIHCVAVHHNTHC